jgi:hypothetical protein
MEMAGVDMGSRPSVPDPLQIIDFHAASDGGARHDGTRIFSG